MLPFIIPFRQRVAIKTQYDRLNPYAMAEIDDPTHPFLRPVSYYKASWRGRQTHHNQNGFPANPI